MCGLRPPPGFGSPELSRLPGVGGAGAAPSAQPHPAAASFAEREAGLEAAAGLLWIPSVLCHHLGRLERASKG